MFAGRAFNKDEVVIRSWETVFLPNNFPQGVSVWYYVFAYNETHMAVPLDYGSLLNHHESANTRVWFGLNNNLHFQVRGIFNVRIIAF